MQKVLLALCVILVLTSCQSAEDIQKQAQQQAEQQIKEEANKAKESLIEQAKQTLDSWGKGIQDWWNSLWNKPPASNPAPNPSPNDPSVYVINASSVNGRSCPQLSCQTVAKFKSGNEINVTGTQQGDAVEGNNVWLVVSYNNSTVYVHSSLADPKVSSPPSAPPAPPVESGTIGGTWISPDTNFRVSGTTITFSAHAFASAGVKNVNFTTTWQGRDWHTACSSTAPKHDDVYECVWNLDSDKVPNGQSGPLTVSFDVYDVAGVSVLAPNGTRQEATGWNSPMHAAKFIGYQPGVGDHTGRDYWAMDFSSDNTAVYPVLPGKVVYAQHNCSKKPGNTEPSCYGNVVVIDHDNGLFSVYTHLKDGSLPKVGQTVEISDQIGIMSDSGTGSVHLHFAVRSGDPKLGANALFGSDTPVRVPLVP